MIIDFSDNEARFKLHLSGGSTYHSGVAFAVNQWYTSCVQYFSPISDRLAVLEIEGTIRVTIIAAYAPTNCYNPAQKDQFYSDLQECVNLIPKGNVSTMASDMNAETGNNTSGWNDCLGANGYGILNARMGVRMLSFVSSNSLVCANLQFRHRTCHKLTFFSHDGQTKKQINHFLVHCSYRSIVNDVRVYTRADIPPDHKLVVALIKRHLRVWRSQQRFDIAFNVSVHNRLSALANSEGYPIQTNYGTTWRPP